MIGIKAPITKAPRQRAITWLTGKNKTLARRVCSRTRGEKSSSSCIMVVAFDHKIYNERKKVVRKSKCVGDESCGVVDDDAEW